jgi:phospholipase D1/2
MFGVKGENNASQTQTTEIGSAAAGMAIPAIAPADPAIAEKMQTEKVATESASDPKSPVMNGGLEIVDEKAALADVDRPAEAEHSGLNHETERVTSNHSLETSSPIYPPGDVPFPTLDGQTDGALLEAESDKKQDRRTTFSASERSARESNGENTIYNQNSTKRRRRATTKGSRRGPTFPYDVVGRDDAEECCGMIQGHLVQFPYDWLETEEKDNHWLYQADLLAPKEIYN